MIFGFYKMALYEIPNVSYSQVKKILRYKKQIFQDILMIIIDPLVSLISFSNQFLIIIYSI